MIFDEYEYCEKLLTRNDLKAIMRKDVLALVKYFLFIGKDREFIYDKVIDFYNHQEAFYDFDLVSSYLEYSFSKAKVYKLRMPTDVTITKAELDNIARLNNEKEEVVLFVMLFVAKYIKATNTENSKNKREYEHILLKQSESSLIKLARSKFTKQEQRDLFHKITKMGYIEPKNLTKSRGLAFLILFDETDGEPAIIYNDPNNVYKLYKAYKSGKIATCDKCCMSTIKNSNRQSMCEKCWKEHRDNQNREKALKWYYKNKNFTS